MSTLLLSLLISLGYISSSVDFDQLPLDEQQRLTVITEDIGNL